MILKKSVIDKVRQDVGLKKEIAELLGCHKETVRRWVRDNHIALTTFACLNLISERLGIPSDSLIENNFEHGGDANYENPSNVLFKK